MQVIRQISDHKKILTVGYGKKGDIGLFDTSIFEEVTLDSLPDGWSLYTPPPIANGNDLLAFVRDVKVSTLSDDEANTLVEKLSPILIVLNQGRYNPLSKPSFDNIQSKLLTLNLTVKELGLVQNLLAAWQKTVAFV
jgi:hypothetical protein